MPGGSAERTLRLLQLLGTEGRALSLAEMAESLGIPKATVHRLCARLLELRFIVRDVDERFYATGPALRTLAFDVLSHGTSSGLRHNLLSRLVEETGETCNFTALDGVEVLYLDRVEAPRPWRLTLSVGVHVPLHCTASGKVFLAAMAPAERRKLLTRLDLDSLTPDTITSMDALEQDIELTRRRGYGFDAEEFVIGLIALAVPVLDRDGSVRAALAMHCPTIHVDEAESLTKLPALRAAALRMAELL